MFIAHAQADSQTKFISPKGDKRCMNPIIDKCDYVVYLKTNGVDSEGRVIKSSAYLAETKEFFARSRFEYTPTYLPEFTAESLTKAIQEGIDKKRELDNAKVVTFSEQQEMNKVEELDFEKLKKEFGGLVNSLPGSADPNGNTAEAEHFRTFWVPRIVQVTEKHLGKGKKVSQCNDNQVEALALIVSEMKEIIEENKN